MQWIQEGKKAQTEIQQLQRKFYKLQRQSHEILDTIGVDLAKVMNEPLQIKMIQLQNITATRAAIMVALNEWKTFRNRLLLTTPIVLDTCQASFPRSSVAMEP